ncbi:MAG: CAP domain-containing protein [Chloroflexi bacterium]|nr:MAG: CAP domain-containing protein [Chloroflexota bacterium]
MRLVSWFGSFLVVVALLIGVIAAVQLRPASGHSLTASPPSPSPIPAAPAESAPAAAQPSRPALVVNTTQQALINQDRARNGLGALTWSSCLYNVARGQAAYLASPNVAFQHYGGVQQDLGCHLGAQVGENIGWWSGGVNDSQLNTMFMNSAEHRANILGPYRYVATAWAVRSDGRAYIAVEFG